VPGTSLTRLLALAALIVFVALGPWLLGVSSAWVVAGVIVAWLVAALVGWTGWLRARAKGRRFERQVPAPRVAARPAVGAPRRRDAGLTVEPAAAPMPAADLEPLSELAPTDAVRAAAAAPAPGGRAHGPAPDPNALPVPPASAVPTPPRGAGPPPRLVPAPPVPPAPSPPAGEHARSGVVRLDERRGEPRRWNLWDLERLVRREAERDPARADEWSYLVFYLRDYAEPGGRLPAEFDGLVHESFGELLERLEPA
jgi:hypothetical protein